MAKWTSCGRGALIGVALVVSGWLNGTATTAAQRDGEDKAARLEFIVTIDGIDAGFFTEVSGLSAEVEVIEFREGTTGAIRKLPGRTKYSNIVLKRGYTRDSALWHWFQKVVGGTHDARTIVITLQTPQEQPVVTYTFQAGWPVKWELSDLDASGNDVMIETIEIAHEGFEVE